MGNVEKGVAAGTAVALGVIVWGCTMSGVALADQPDPRDPANYQLWFYPTGEPVIVVEHEEAAEVPFNESVGTYVRPWDESRFEQALAGELYLVQQDGSRGEEPEAFVGQGNAPDEFRSITLTMEGTYELDVYELLPVFPVHHSEPASGWRAWLHAQARALVAPIAYAFDWNYLTTLTFTLTKESTAPPPTCTLTLTPDTIPLGGSAQLAWESTNATDATFTEGLLGGAQPTSLASVIPATTTTYTLRVTGPGGTTTCSATLAVEQPSEEPEEPEDPEPQTLGERAAALAKELVQTPNKAYTLGARGWEYTKKEFVEPTDILNGYTFKSGLTGTVMATSGIDCSGMIYWAFNKSNDPLTEHGNYVANITADGMFRNIQSDPIAESELEPGDTLFFDWGTYIEATKSWNGIKDGRIDHVAMYVGESEGFDIVNPTSENQGITRELANVLSRLDGFEGFRRIHQHGFQGSIQGASPIDLIVTDPDGITLSHTDVIPSDEEFIREVPGEMYYSEIERGHDGNPIDRVYLASVKDGSYQIEV
ncbi:hypothetical protein GVX82_01185, partial [Patescibacteria group bacterium]|nr:hypothetical protein [Patescibacteria group bacterium]